MFKNQHEFNGAYLGQTVISNIYQGTVVIWQAVKSCFGKGSWINTAPWVNTDGWKNIP